MVNERIDLEEICLEFYKDLYKGQPTLEEALMEVFEGLPVAFTEDMNEELTKPFSSMEFFKAIEGMTDGKAPGHEGIPAEFFFKCWKFIGDEFTDMIIQALDRGEFHQGITKGVITLIPKEGDLLDLNYWRPITLLTVMYNFFCQSYANEATTPTYGGD